MVWDLIHIIPSDWYRTSYIKIKFEKKIDWLRLMDFRKWSSLITWMDNELKISTLWSYYVLNFIQSRRHTKQDTKTTHVIPSTRIPKSDPNFGWLKNKNGILFQKKYKLSINTKTMMMMITKLNVFVYSFWLRNTCKIRSFYYHNLPCVEALSDNIYTMLSDIQVLYH